MHRYRGGITGPADNPTEPERIARRTTFDEDPVLYDRARPGYAAQLFEDIVSLGAVPTHARVLEIAPGTGKATLPLAQRGYDITAVEIGAGMADFARRQLAAYPGVRVVTAAFEAWPLPEEPFDLVVCAQAFHWLDPAIRLGKTAAALRTGGSLAVFGHQHVAGSARDVFEEIQGCYERFMPGTQPGLKLVDVAARPHEYAELFEGCELFDAPVFRRYPWEQRYTTAEYLDVLRTYSGHIDLAEPNRGALFECISGIIDGRYGGHITKAYVTDMALARRR